MSKKTWRSKLLRTILWRWHKRLGLCLILLLIWLCITGIFLNHTDDFNLAETPIHQSFLLKLYGIKRPDIVSYSIGNEWISYSGSHLYHNDKTITYCTGKFSGIARASSSPDDTKMLAVICGEDTILLTPSGEMIERLNTQSGASQTLGKFLTPQRLPDDLQNQLNTALVSLNWERVMLDLHAGRIFGLGPWLMDIIAVLLILLGASGLASWLSHKKKKRY